MRAAIALLLTLSWVAASSAHGEEPIQKYRHDVYEAVGGHMGAIVGIVREGVRPEDLGYHADAMLGLAKIAPHVFPAGSGGGDTEALPEIWEQPEEFKRRMDDFRNAAETFAAAVASGDRGQIGAGLQGLGRSCKGCHDNFRAD